MADGVVLPGPEDVAFFQENGYWLSGRVLDEERLERLRAAMDDVYAGRYDTGREPWMGGWKPGGDPLQIRKTDNAHWSSTVLRELATDRTIGAMAACLMQTDQVRLWHDQLLYKPGAGPAAGVRSGNVGWHQDRNYWQCTTPDLVTAWVAFDDVTPANGCMYVVPGSHRWGLVDGNFFDTDLDRLRAQIEAQSGRPFQTVPCVLQAGAVSFHHCLTIHGSGPNTTDRPRRSLVLHLMPEGAHYVAGTPNDNHMNVILLKERGGKAGDRFEGDLWPQLFP